MRPRRPEDSFIFLLCQPAHHTLDDGSKRRRQRHLDQRESDLVGDGDTLVEGAVTVAGPGGFSALAELIVVTSNIVRMAFYLILSLGATAGLFFLAGTVGSDRSSGVFS